MKRILVAVLVIAFIAASGAAYAKKKRVINTVGGALIPGLGLAIDASYEPKLDNFAAGYKVLNVAIINNSFNIIEMSPQRDGWWIKTKAGDKKYKLVSDLRSEDPNAWRNLPDRAKNLITYPLLLPIGARQVIDLFVPANVPVEDFDKVIVFINSLNTTIEVLARQ